jgi:hypothetical protein
MHSWCTVARTQSIRLTALRGQGERGVDQLCHGNPSLAEPRVAVKLSFQIICSYGFAARPLTLSDAAFGVSYVSIEGVGCYSNVFF